MLFGINFRCLSLLDFKVVLYWVVAWQLIPRISYVVYKGSVKVVPYLVTSVRGPS